MLAMQGFAEKQPRETVLATDFLLSFKLVNMVVTLQLQGDCSLPAFKGSMWHGWFGHALKQVSESTFNVLYQQQDHEQPKPYAIEPGKDQKIEWRAGELIQFSLCLFGSACDLAPIVHKALSAGEALGLGKARTPVSLVALNTTGPIGQVALYQACSLAEYVAKPVTTNLSLSMLLQTPLRLKQQGKIIHNAQLLTGKLLAGQAKRRLIQLAKYWVGPEPDILEALARQNLVDEHAKLNTRLYFEDWQRYSLKQREFIPFGGFKGVINIHNCSPDLYQWLKIGEALQLGGKTTFGLGCYQLVPAFMPE
jgi:hypothetical protein